MILFHDSSLSDAGVVTPGVKLFTTAVAEYVYEALGSQEIPASFGCFLGPVRHS
jgi:hypothetical protein